LLLLLINMNLVKKMLNFLELLIVLVVIHIVLCWLYFSTI
jgi:hypothetical protein